MASFKRWIYKYFGYILVSVFIFIISSFSFSEFMGWDIRWKFIVTVLSLLITSALLIQRQRLQEAELFHSLFREFNNRYDEMNECLANIKRSEYDLGDTEKSCLVDYFNLCAEEYLFYQKGYIPEKVWKSWERGMAFYMEDERIHRFWQKESETESYYGLEMPNSSKERITS